MKVETLTIVIILEDSPDKLPTISLTGNMQAETAQEIIRGYLQQKAFEAGKAAGQVKKQGKKREPE